MILLVAVLLDDLVLLRDEPREVEAETGAAQAGVAEPAREQDRERLLRLLAATTFIIFFQAYMVAPIIPRLARVCSTSPERVGLAVPASWRQRGACREAERRDDPDYVVGLRAEAVDGLNVGLLVTAPRRW